VLLVSAFTVIASPVGVSRTGPSPGCTANGAVELAVARARSRFRYESIRPVRAR
jgi:hypothetical protein